MGKDSKHTKLHDKQVLKQEVKTDVTYGLGAIVVIIAGFVAWRVYQSSRQ